MKSLILLTFTLFSGFVFGQNNRPSKYLYEASKKQDIQKWIDDFYENKFIHCRKKVDLFFWQKSDQAETYKIEEIGFRGYFEEVVTKKGERFYFSEEVCSKPKFKFEFEIGKKLSDKDIVDPLIEQLDQSLDLFLGDMMLRNVDSKRVQFYKAELMKFKKKFKGMKVKDVSKKTHFDDMRVVFKDGQKILFQYRHRPI